MLLSTITGDGGCSFGWKRYAMGDNIRPGVRVLECPFFERKKEKKIQQHQQQRREEHMLLDLCSNGVRALRLKKQQEQWAKGFLYIHHTRPFEPVLVNIISV